MIKLWLIRHGKTEGNKLARYIGTTDEPLCQEGIEFLKKMDYPKVQEIYVSPLRRCVQTAEILFPEKPVHIIEELAECEPVYEEIEGFSGDLENCRSYDELPDSCKRYIEKLEELCECPIKMVGVGPARDQNLER